MAVADGTAASDAAESSSKRLSYVPYQRKGHARNASAVSSTQAGTSAGDAAEGEPSETASTPASLGAKAKQPASDAALALDQPGPSTPTNRTSPHPGTEPSGSRPTRHQPSSHVTPSKAQQHTPTRTSSIITRPSMTGISPSLAGIGLVRPHRDFDAPPPPLRIASKLKANDTPSRASASTSSPSAPKAPTVSISAHTERSERPAVTRTPSGGSTSLAGRASDPTRSPQKPSNLRAEPSDSDREASSRPNSSSQGRSRHDRNRSRNSIIGIDASRASSGATSPHNSGSSSPILGTSGVTIPAHVNSYAALLAAQSKFGPIPVPQGVAIANAVGIDPSTQATLATSDARTSAYRSGFQPKGVLRVRTGEFAELRRKKRSEGEMEYQRMDRRLAKLIAIHFPPNAGAEKAADANNAKSSASSFIDFDLDELKRDPGAMLKRSGTDLWTSFRARGRGEDPAIRAAEQNIVMWQDDSEAKTCPICDTPFSLAVRKHHCRLCGRVVCASPHLTRLTWAEQMGATTGKTLTAEQRTALEAKCSGNIVADPVTGRIEDAKEGATASSIQQRSNGSAATPPATGPAHKGVRICRDCKAIVRKRQYMLDDEPFPAFIKLYEALMRVQREIEQSLPEFQEMVLGLQKQDQNAALGSSIKANIELQRDAVQARKQLLANFATYDELAKRIRKLPTSSNGSDVGGIGDAAQERIQHAIFTRANLFLQQNMLPLQSLPKPGSKKPTGDGASDSSVSLSSSPRAESPRPGAMHPVRRGHKPGNDSVSSMVSFRSLFGGSGRGSVRSNATADLQDLERNESEEVVDNTPSDPTEVREQLKVLLEQERLVAEYVESAAKARKFDDARTLKNSHQDLCKEILRLQKKLVVKGQGR